MKKVFGVSWHLKLLFGFNQLESVKRWEISGLQFDDEPSVRDKDH